MSENNSLFSLESDAFILDNNNNSNNNNLSQIEDNTDNEDDTNNEDNLSQFQNNNNNNSLPQTIEDEPNAHFKPIQGKYSPYFSNFTEQMLFFWITKYIIGNLLNAFELVLSKHFSKLFCNNFIL